MITEECESELKNNMQTCRHRSATPAQGEQGDGLDRTDVLWCFKCMFTRSRVKSATLLTWSCRCARPPEMEGWHYACVPVLLWVVFLQRHPGLPQECTISVSLSIYVCVCVWVCEDMLNLEECTESRRGFLKRDNKVAIFSCSDDSFIYKIQMWLVVI